MDRLVIKIGGTAAGCGCWASSAALAACWTTILVADVSAAVVASAVMMNDGWYVWVRCLYKCAFNGGTPDNYT